MFTGIVGGVTTVSAVRPLSEGRELDIARVFNRDIALGDSVALDGVCTTVARMTESVVTVQLLGSTMACSTLGSVRVGDPLNWELSLTPATPMGGHYVTGHVDEMGRIDRVIPRGSWSEVSVVTSGTYAHLVVLKGSVAINGTSLTVMGCGPSSVMCHVIGFTHQHTTLGRAQVGKPVNIEYDILAKYLYNSPTYRYMGGRHGGS